MTAFGAPWKMVDWEQGLSDGVIVHGVKCVVRVGLPLSVSVTQGTYRFFDHCSHIGLLELISYIMLVQCVKTFHRLNNILYCYLNLSCQ